MDTLIKNIYNNILEGQQKIVEAKTQEALDSGITPKVILDEGMIAAMAEVGRLFEIGDYFVPEMLVAARAMKAGLALLKPQLVKENVKTLGKIGIGTVQGDLHDIGKNLVGIILEGAGFEILDLGTDVSPERFVAAANNVDIIALSALLTTTMPNMGQVIDALEKAGKRNRVKIIVDGAPVTETYAAQIGADGYAPDASRAVAIAKDLMTQINA